MDRIRWIRNTTHDGHKDMFLLVNKESACVCALCLRPTSQSVRYRVRVLGEVGLVEALCIAVSEQPGDLLLQHRPDHLRQLLALRH